MRERLATHEAMRATSDGDRASCFFGRYAFLVWDFMTLVGSMRERFTRTRPYPHSLGSLDTPTYLWRFLESTWHLVTRGSHEELQEIA